MHFSLISLFPEIIHTYLSLGIVGRAVASNLTSYSVYNPRDYTKLAHKQVDDRPYGGGAGMLLRADVMKDTLNAIFEDHHLTKDYDRSKVQIVVTAAYGKQYTQQTAVEFAKIEHLIIICGRYEGIDQRFLDAYCDVAVSAGPYIVSGGELPALTIVDSVTRLMEGVLGNAESLQDESHNEVGEQEYPQYTRPIEFEGVKIPSELRSGNHQVIREWNRKHTRSNQG